MATHLETLIDLASRFVKTTDENENMLLFSQMAGVAKDMTAEDWKQIFISAPSEAKPVIKSIELRFGTKGE